MTAERIFIGAGSNIEPERNIPAAVLLLKEYVELVALSTFYRTTPLERPEQDEYLNGVLEIRCAYPPRPLKFDVLRNIEERIGRRRGDDRYAAREIDLDILVYGARRIDEVGLLVPDPDIATRAFVAVPLLELARDLVLPGGQPLGELESAGSDAELRRDQRFTEELKARLQL